VRQGPANLEAKLNALRAQLSMTELQKMKAQGISSGTITEAEWPKYESQIASLDTIQDEEQMVTALQAVEDVMKKLKGDVQSAFQKKYGMASGSAIAANEKPPVNAQSIVDELRRRGVVN
jgi:hypothetical protein